MAMFSLSATALAVTIVVRAGPYGPPSRTPDCASLLALQQQSVRITEAVAVAATATGAVTVAHCRVSGVIDKETRFTALLPDHWNERLFAGGGGGFVGTVDNQAAASVNQGYATIGTDTGHEGTPIDAAWALGNRERQVNFGYLAIHRVTEVAKALIKAYYGRDPRYSYFYGCSNGGRQGLMEAQRYPADFDGIVSCAPALNFTNIATAFVRHDQLLFPDPKALDRAATTPANLKLLESRVLARCDTLDGVRDSVLTDPRDCGFKVSELPVCSAGQPASDCVTRAQQTAIEAIHAPTVSQGVEVYPGQPFGGEGDPGGWRGWITGVDSGLAAATQGRQPSLQFAFGTDFFKYFVAGRSDWDYSGYDLAHWRDDTRAVAEILDADNPDLGAFRRRGGKLILAHGWADPALNPLSTIAYYEQVQTRDPQVRDDVRLFMMPGVLHCAGGLGPDRVDWFAAIAEWVEHGHAPDRLIAQKLNDDHRVVNARPLCAYPLRAVYDGKGSTTSPESYECSSSRR